MLQRGTGTSLTVIPLAEWYDSNRPFQEIMKVPRLTIWIFCIPTIRCADSLFRIGGRPGRWGHHYRRRFHRPHKAIAAELTVIFTISHGLTTLPPSGTRLLPGQATTTAYGWMTTPSCGNRPPSQQYYYGRELCCHQRYQDAIPVFENFLKDQPGWPENKIDACHHCACC